MSKANEAANGMEPGPLDRERIVATAGFNRWLVPPAALAIHLCIGMAYGFSVFWKPLQGALVGADGKALPECSAGAITFSVGRLDRGLDGYQRFVDVWLSLLSTGLHRPY